MGLFSSSSSTPNADPSHPPPSQDGGFIAPDRSTREACYGGRDSFFRCLDANGIVDSVREDEKAKAVCGNELKEFEKVCAASWVSGTDTQRGETIGWIKADFEMEMLGDVLQEEAGDGA